MMSDPGIDGDLDSADQEEEPSEDERPAHEVAPENSERSESPEISEAGNTEATTSKANLERADRYVKRAQSIATASGKTLVVGFTALIAIWYVSLRPLRAHYEGEKLRLWTQKLENSQSTAARIQREIKEVDERLKELNERKALTEQGSKSETELKNIGRAKSRLTEEKARVTKKQVALAENTKVPAELLGREIGGNTTLEKLNNSLQTLQEKQKQLPESVSLKFLGIDLTVETWLAPGVWCALLCYLALTTGYRRRRIIALHAQAIRLQKEEEHPVPVDLAVGLEWWLAPLPQANGDVVTTTEFRRGVGWKPREYGGLIGIATIFLVATAMLAHTTWIAVAGFDVENLSMKASGEPPSDSRSSGFVITLGLLIVGWVTYLWVVGRWVVGYTVPDRYFSEEHARELRAPSRRDFFNSAGVAAAVLGIGLLLRPGVPAAKTKSEVRAERERRGRGERNQPRFRRRGARSVATKKEVGLYRHNQSSVIHLVVGIGPEQTIRGVERINEAYLQPMKLGKKLVTDVKSSQSELLKTIDGLYSHENLDPSTTLMSVANLDLEDLRVRVNGKWFAGEEALKPNFISDEWTIAELAQRIGDALHARSKLRIAMDTYALEREALRLLTVQKEPEDAGTWEDRLEQALSLVRFGIVLEPHSTRLYHLLAGLAVRYDRPDMLLYCIESVTSAFTDGKWAETMATAKDSWIEETSAWYQRWTDGKKDPKWSGVVIPPNS